MKAMEVLLNYLQAVDLGDCLAVMLVLSVPVTHCGKSVFPFWGSRKMLSRILKRKPIICSHCGEEVETGND